MRNVVEQLPWGGVQPYGAVKVSEAELCILVQRKAVSDAIVQSVLPNMGVNLPIV